MAKKKEVVTIRSSAAEYLTYIASTGDTVESVEIRYEDAPSGKIKKSDVTIAKNYLTEFEMSQLNRMVTAYLDFAEDMALRKIPLTMDRKGKYEFKR